MYAYIKGNLAYTSRNFAVIDVNGVGYKINISEYTLSKLPQSGAEITLYTYLNVKEDALELFGFLTREELSTYELLISVSGVGPKVGLAILSTLTPEKFSFSVVSGNIKEITKTPGVGPKLAQRIILELKDKIKTDSAISALPDVEQNASDDGVLSEAAEALTVLGYTPMEAKSAVAGLSGTVEEIISQALKNMRRK